MSYSIGSVSGEGIVGGLVGGNYGFIATSYCTSKVSGSSFSVGGLVGRNGPGGGKFSNGTVLNCYSTGEVDGNRRVGGLVGENYRPCQITMSYSTGTVTGKENVGGLVGVFTGGWGPSHLSDGTTASFWDIETSGQPTSDGGIGLTTAEMQTASTFLDAGWDFVGETDNGPNDVWKIVEGQTYPLLSWQTYGGGTGEPNDPYLIYTAEHLNALGAEPNDYDRDFKLMADIDLSGFSYDRAVIADMNDDEIGRPGTPFTGVFDGNGRTISHLTITGERYLGLFGKLGIGAKVSDLGLQGVDVNGTGEHIGGLVGCSWGIITKSYTTGTVSGSRRIGGLVGGSWGIITKSYSTTVVTGDQSVGGLVGKNLSGGIATSYSTGTVSGNYYVGGLVGNNNDSITTSYSTSTITGKRYVGGLAGNNGGNITTSYSTGMASGNQDVGGLVGENVGGIVSNCYSTGTVSGDEDVGGLVGNNRGNIGVSFWDMNTSGQTTSAAGTGLTTDEMQNVQTYLDNGWDFVDEVLNGTCDYWQISLDDYPKLRCHNSASPVMPEGLGTAQEPYLIRDVRELGSVWFEPIAHYRLEASLDLSGITWSLAVVPWFGGTFDANGYMISNLHIQGIGYLGLFGQLGYGATISNLGLEAADVNGTYGCIGGLVGGNQGIIGASYSTGTINGEYAVGGLVGCNWRSGSVTTSYSTGTVAGGGFVGGLVGENFGVITTSNSAGKVDGGSYIGGLVGWNEGGSITRSYSSGTVNGGGLVGGLVGYNTGSVTRCYSIGAVSASQDVGGLVGSNFYEWGSDGTETHSFWDTQTSGWATSDGGTGLTTAEMQTASTFLEVGWDFVDETENGTDDIWWILEGQDYPRLWWELTEEEPGQ